MAAEMKRKKTIFNDQTELEAFEIAIWESDIDRIQQERLDIEVQIKAHEHENAQRKILLEKIHEKLYVALSNCTGMLVGEHNRGQAKQLAIQRIGKDGLEEMIDKAVLAAGDELFSHPDRLIQPAQQREPYAIIDEESELNDKIPAADKGYALNSLPSLFDLFDSAKSRASEIINEYTSKNTYDAYRGDLVYWHAWISAIGSSFKTLITEESVCAFIIQHIETTDKEVDQKLYDRGYKSQLGPHKLATVKRRVAALSVFLDQKQWPNPCRNKSITELLRKLTKKYGTSKPAGRAITKEILDDMLVKCGDKLGDIRDAALLLFAWSSGGRRRSEVTNADMKNLTATPDGDYIYTLQKSKTDQEGHGHSVPVKGRAADALTKWLSMSEVKEGAIFRAVLKGEKVGNALSPVDVYRIVKRRLKAAGYDESLYGAHSLRSGFVTEAGRQNKSLGDVMALTTHRSVSTVMKYYQAGSIINNSAANLAD